MTQDELLSLTLRLLDSGIDSRLGRGDHYLSDALQQAGARVSRAEVQQAVWSLVSQGLAYIDFWQPAPENWMLLLTDAGRSAARDEQVNPDDPAGYLRRLLKDVPAASPAVQMYAREALHAYNRNLYIAATVMLGVASEAAFLEVAEALVGALSGQERKNFATVLRNIRQPVHVKFVEFRKRVEPLKPHLPPELAEGMDLSLNSVIDLLRISRNDAGHPTGRTVHRDDCFINLRMFIRYLRRLYDLRASLVAMASEAS